jgi:hypothetical protein
MTERDLAVTPDGGEIYFTAVPGGGFPIASLVVMREGEHGWSGPEVVPFSGEFMDIEPTLSADGRTLLFVSNRPADPTLATGAEDIWKVEREGEGWGEPVNLGPPVNSARSEFFPSLTADGTLYFTRQEEDGGEAIYRARREGDGYLEPERLGPEVNGGRARFNAWVAPDESFLIVPMLGREDSLGGVDYYVVFRSPEDEWSEPVNLGPAINRAEGAEWSASLSPDGRYLFFMSSQPSIEDRHSPEPFDYAALQDFHMAPRNGNADIWWVEASFLEELRRQAPGE